MTDLRRTIKCSNCGNEAGIYLNSELDISELQFSGKCRCGSSLQISYSIVGSAPAPQQPSGEASPTETLVNIDESLFAPEIPSDTLRDLMED